MIKKFLIILAMSTNSLKGVIEEGDILSNEEINVILLGDIHIQDSQSKKQVCDTFRAIKELNALLIIEDTNENIDSLEVPEKIELKIKGDFLNSSKNYLNPLGYLCKTSNIDNANVEFRAIWIAFSQNCIKLEDAIRKTKDVLNELKNQFDKLGESDTKKALIGVCQEIENDPKWDLLMKYQNLKFNEFIEKISIEELYSIKGMNFKNESYKKKLIAKFFKNKLKKKFWEISVPYLTFTYRMIEMQILKELNKNRNKKNIFICAGVNHTKRIKECLSEFKTIKSSDISYKKCLCYCVFNCCYCYCDKIPKALDIQEFLKDFIDQNKKEEETIWV